MGAVVVAVDEAGITPPAPARRRPSRTTAGIALTVVVAAVVLATQLPKRELWFDETYTAMFGTLSPSHWPAIWRHDAHPPLDYLLRVPFVRWLGSEWAIRLPSAVAVVGSVAIVGAWLRRTPVLALTAAAIMAVDPFFIHYGSEARMYALMVLWGTVGAVIADRWARGEGAHAPRDVGVIVALATLTHVSGFLLAGGLFLFAGLRRDRNAWRWRAGIAAGLAVWAVLFGPFFLAQRQHPPEWIPRTTPAVFADTVGRLLQDDPQLMNVALLTIACGGVVLAFRHPRLFHVWACLFAAPVVAGGLLGIWAPFFQARSLAVCSWGAVVALAALVDAAFAYRRVAGALAVALLFLLVAPASRREIDAPPTNSTAALDYIRANATDGDVVAIRPHFLLQITRWYLSERRPGAEQTVNLPINDTDAFELGTGPLSDRVWLMENIEHEDPPPTLPLCAPTHVADGHRVWCVLVAPS